MSESKSGTDRNERLRSWLAISIGVGLLALACCAGISTRSFIRTAVRADGVVTQLPHGGSHPYIEFVADSGQHFSYPQGGLIFGYRVGQKVRVLYSAEHPDREACVDAFGALWASSLFLSGIGALFVVTGLSRLLVR
jgi:hypothetical protein